jgi:hypothetical protein
LGFGLEEEDKKVCTTGQCNVLLWMASEITSDKGALAASMAMAARARTVQRSMMIRGVAVQEAEPVLVLGGGGGGSGSGGGGGGVSSGDTPQCESKRVNGVLADGSAALPGRGARA